MEQKEKPQVVSAVLFGIVALFAFYICYLVLAIAVSSIFKLLYKIPIIARILAALFRLRGDSPDILAGFIAIIYSFSAVEWMLGRFCDNRATKNLSLNITGALLVLLNIYALIVNVTSGGTFILNILFCIAGILMILRKGKG